MPIENIRELLLLSERRRERLKMDSVSFSILPRDLRLAKEQLAEDGLSMTEFLRMLVAAYVRREPGVLSIVDDSKRSRAKSSRGPKLSSDEIDDLLSDVGSGMIDGEDDK